MLVNSLKISKCKLKRFWFCYSYLSFSPNSTTTFYSKTSDANGTCYFSSFAFLHFYSYVGHFTPSFNDANFIPFFFPKTQQLWTLMETI